MGSKIRLGFNREKEISGQKGKTIVVPELPKRKAQPQTANHRAGDETKLPVNRRLELLTSATKPNAGIELKLTTVEVI